MLASVVYWFTWFPGACVATFALLVLIYKAVLAVNKIVTIVPVVEEIKHEFSPNSGSSMRDQVNALRSGQTRVIHRLDGQDWRMDRHEAALERIEDKL